MEIERRREGEKREGKRGGKGKGKGGNYRSVLGGGRLIFVRTIKYIWFIFNLPIIIKKFNTNTNN